MNYSNFPFDIKWPFEWAPFWGGGETPTPTPGGDVMTLGTLKFNAAVDTNYTLEGTITDESVLNLTATAPLATTDSNYYGDKMQGMDVTIALNNHQGYRIGCASFVTHQALPLGTEDQMTTAIYDALIADGADADSISIIHDVEVYNGAIGDKYDLEWEKEGNSYYLRFVAERKDFGTIDYCARSVYPVPIAKAHVSEYNHNFNYGDTVVLAAEYELNENIATIPFTSSDAAYIAAGDIADSITISFDSDNSTFSIECTTYQIPYSSRAFLYPGPELST